VLDNCEHLIAACAQLAETLLQACPHLRILATSREPLGMAGERAYRVPPLSIPGGLDPLRGCPVRPSGVREASPEGLNARTPERLLQYEAVRLFVERAATAQPAFALTVENAAAVAQICCRLDGIPLALELAAARLKALPVEQLGQRLDDMFGLLTNGRRTALPRHQTLQALVDWSYDLLTPSEQALLRRLSVFAGGCPLEAAEAICCDLDPQMDADEHRCSRPSDLRSSARGLAPHNASSVPPRICGSSRQNAPVFDLLARLVEKSLVLYEERAWEGRYRLLEMIREYARERLAESSEEDALREGHARFFLALAETAELELTGGDPRRWLDWLEREHDNLRTALAWSVESGELEIGLRLGSALEPFWERRGYLQEGRSQLLRLLAQPGAAAPTAARARALASAGWFSRFQHDIRATRRLLEESLNISRALEDRVGIATVLLRLGWLAVDYWDAETARPPAEEGLAIRRALGEPRGIADALHCMAWVARHEGDLATACALAEESLAICQALEDRSRIVGVLGSLGHMTFLRRDMARARPLIEESLAAARELDDKVAIAWAITRLGYVAHWQEEYPAARALFEESLPLWRELDARDGLIETLFHLAYTLQHQGEYQSAYTIFQELHLNCRQWGLSDYNSLALLGNAAGHLGRWEEAATHCAESLRYYHSGRTWHVVAWDLTGMARVSLARGRPTRAARLLGAAEALWAVSTAPRWPNERDDFRRLVLATRAQFGEAEFAAAWAEGQATPVEQAIAEALEEAPPG
jgi:predicted ATPase